MRVSAVDGVTIFWSEAEVPYGYPAFKSER
jgi:hypothetical protein